MVPAVGQGALGIEIREGDAAVEKIIQTLDHAASHHAALAERAFLKALVEVVKHRLPLMRK